MIQDLVVHCFKALLNLLHFVQSLRGMVFQEFVPYNFEESVMTKVYYVCRQFYEAQKICLCDPEWGGGFRNQNLRADIWDRVSLTEQGGQCDPASQLVFEPCIFSTSVVCREGTGILVEYK